MLRTLARLVVTALVGLVVTLAIGQATAHAEAPGGNQGPIYLGPPQCFEDGHCRMPGDRMASDAQVRQAIADARAHRGQHASESTEEQAPGAHSAGSRSSGRAAPPVVVEGVNHNVAPLPSTYRDPSYDHGTATRASVFGSAGAYGGSHP